ncbi:MAG: methyl-accepting chemotaxis protein [Desulfobacterium sp.]|nr:methyl-accepting chemotaxis protein [Desulfobacterium sp.]
MKNIIHLFLEIVQKGIVPSEKQVTRIGSQLSDLSQAISSLMSDVEPDFLKIGQKLQCIYSESQELSHMVMDAVKFVDNGTGDMSLGNVGELAQESVEKLKFFQRGISESLESLYSGRVHLEKLSGLCTQTDKIPLLLDVIALNIAIESNRSEKANEMFAAFIEEVKQLSRQMGAISQALYDDTESTRVQQINSQEELSNHLNHLSNLSDAAEKILDEATSEIRQLMDTSLSSLKKAGECSGDIANQVSQIVMAIQFHDIVRQQIEHVVMALNDAGTLCTQPPQDGGHTVSLNDTLGRAYSIVQLQNAQVKNAVSEIDGAYRKILNAFESIEIKETELVRCMGSSITSIADENKAESPFSVISASLENLNDLMSQAGNLNRQVEKAFSEASESTSELSKHIEDVQKLSLDLHRKALNAIIKSAHLGEMGGTLEVFAKEVARTSDNTNDFTEGVTEIIEKIRKLRGGLKKDPSNAPEQNSLVGKTSEITLHQSTETISNTYHMFLENASMTSKLSQKLESSIADAKSELSFMVDFSNKMTLLVGQSEAMLQQIGQWRKADHQETATGMIEASQRYTMESERAVHLSLNEASFATGLPENAPEDPANDVDSNIDLFEGIDLFEEEEISTDASVSAENKTEKQCPTETDEPSDDNSEFDDNIELF